MIFPSSLRFSVAGINRAPCHTARLSENVNLLAHDGDAGNTINAPDRSSAFNTSPPHRLALPTRSNRRPDPNPYPPPQMTPDPIAQLFAVVTLHRTLSVQARGDLKAATPSLVEAIRHQSGQSAKLETILWSAWNGQLSDALAGLDVNLAVAAVAMIAARAFLAGDADCLLHQIIRESGTQPPAVMSIPVPDHAG
jgi:hypothetical protein